MSCNLSSIDFDSARSPCSNEKFGFSRRAPDNPTSFARTLESPDRTLSLPAFVLRVVVRIFFEIYEELPQAERGSRRE